MTYGWHTATMIVAWAPWANWSPSVYPTGEIFAIGVVPRAKYSPSVLSHGRNIRHRWRGFRPNAGTDNNHGMGELVAMGVVPRAKYSP